MATLANLFVQLGLKSEGFKRGIEGETNRLKKFGSTVSGLGQKMSLGLTTPLIGMGIAAVKAGSDLNESLSAVNTVYGPAANKIAAVNGTVATSLGVSRQEALEAAAMMGALYKGVGLTSNQMADFANQSLSAAADLASFYNVPVPESLAAIRSGLTGEYEPLKRFGIILTEDKIQAYALAHGLADASGAISDQGKLAARQALIMEGLGAASGDMARTSGGLANQLRIVKAEVQDVAAQFGTILLPYVLQGVTYVRKLVDIFAKMDKRWQKWIILGALVLAVLGPVLIAVGAMLPAIGALISVVSALIPVLLFLLSPIGLVIIAVALLGYIFRHQLFKLLVKLGELLVVTGKFLWKVIKPFIDFVKVLISVAKGGKTFGDRFQHLPGILEPLAFIFVRIVKMIRVFFKTWQDRGFFSALLRMETQLRALGQSISWFILQLTGSTKIANAVIQVFYRLGTTFRYLVKTVQSLISGDWAGAWENFVKAARQAWLLLQTVLTLIWQTVLYTFQSIPWSVIGEALWRGAKAAFGLILDGLKVVWTVVRPWLWDRAEAIAKAIWKNRQKIYDVGRDILSMLWTGIKSLAGWLWNQMPPVINGIWTAIQYMAPIFYNAGRDIVSALWTGIASLGGWLFSQIWNFAKNHIEKPLRDAIGWNSPPKVFLEAGLQSSRAFGMGVFSGLGTIERSMSALGDRAQPPGAWSLGMVGARTGVLQGASDRRDSGVRGPITFAANSIVINEQTNGRKIVRQIRQAIQHVDAGGGEWR